jgi:glycosyltransferase involved in cell wall biosynthesis
MHFEYESLQIIVPVYNEQKGLANCLQSIQWPTQAPGHIYVCDGGSTDQTIAVAAAHNRVRIVQSAKGRGVQIATGLQEILQQTQSNNHLIVVLHADTQVQKNTLTHVWEYVKTHSECAGGCCSARYKEANTRFRVSEWLNDMRVRWLTIAFGDQMQFFHSSVFSPEYLVSYPLMEDIEISYKVQKAGQFAFLKQPVWVSARRWKQSGWRYTAKVMLYSMCYIGLRKLGYGQVFSQKLYGYYYNSANCSKPNSE